MVLFKGRLLFKQYLPLKRARFGVKIFSTCESSTGYTLKFRVYAGKDGTTQDITRATPPVPGGGKTDLLTVYMCLPYIDMGYHVFGDNW